MLGDAWKKEVEKHIDEALLLIHLKGAGRRLPLREIRESEIALEEGTVFTSRHLATFLGSSREILLMGATAGSEIGKVIGEDTAGGNITRGVVFDAAASEMVDGALDWIVSYYNQELRREGKSLLQARFSAGYGDFLLENQRSVFRLLEFDRIGVDITEHCLLIPEKSVTAITGIQ
ncbi:MAG: methionine synthase [Deltaproteobacteria bacterium]|nr:methionine synthase [Deltaproteobacteria bacterium]